MAREVWVGMKGDAIKKLYDQIGDELAKADKNIEIIFYGDADEHGSVLNISNDDMERDEVPDDACYVSFD